MTVLSKTSPIYLEETKPKKYVVSVREDATGLFFSKDLSEKLNMTPQKTILFLDTDKNWQFACDDYPDGFSIKRNTNTGAQGHVGHGYIIWDAALVRIFLRQIQHKAPCSFYANILDKLDGNGNHIAEILVDKTIDQLKRQLRGG